MILFHYLHEYFPLLSVNRMVTRFLDREHLRLTDFSNNVVASQYRLVENTAAECQSFSGEKQRQKALK